MRTEFADYDPIVIPKQRPYLVILAALVMLAVISVLSWSVWNALAPRGPDYIERID